MGDAVDPYPRVAAFAGRRRGVVTRGALRALGPSDDQIDRWVSGGRLRRLFRGVYLVGTVLPPLALEQAALVYAGSGAALSQLSAGALWGLTQQPPQVHRIAPGRRLRSTPDLRPHAPRLERREITRRDGLARHHSR